MKTFTKELWEVKAFPKYPSHKAPKTVVVSDRGIIAYCESDSFELEENETHARLIAAAPEMYQWLKKEYSTCSHLSVKGLELAAIIHKIEGK